MADVRTYAYHDIGRMLDDLESGTIGAVMKLAPVMRWLVGIAPPYRWSKNELPRRSWGLPCDWATTTCAKPSTMHRRGCAGAAF